jgi:chromosome segregation ATPase
MSKSIDTILKELIESQSKQTVALNEKLTAMAGDNNTYFDRMKKMEDGLTEAMKKVIEMDASMRQCNSDMAKKVEEMEAKYAGMYKAPEPMTEDKEDGAKVEVEVSKEDSKDESEDESDMKEKVGGFKETGGRYQGPMDAKAEYEDASTTAPRQMDQNAKAEDAPAPAEGGNVLEGINKVKVTGQPDDEEAPKMKRIRGGNKSKAEELNEQPKAEEIKEVKAVQEKPATVASEDSSINATAKALNSKIEAVLEKLASVNQTKAEAEFEATKVALAKETKSKEEAVSQMKALSEKLDALMTKVSTIEKSASTVEQKAAQIVARTGVEAVEVSLDKNANSPEQTDAQVFNQFETLKGIEQRKFYLANKAVIERHASSLLRAKRS